MPPHLLRCQGIAVAYYSFTLGRLVVAKRKSRRRGSWGTLDFRSIRVKIPAQKKIKIRDGKISDHQ